MSSSLVYLLGYECCLGQIEEQRQGEEKKTRFECDLILDPVILKHTAQGFKVFKSGSSVECMRNPSACEPISVSSTFESPCLVSSHA